MYTRDNRGNDECTAAPGVMGHHSCRRYPGCGCGDPVRLNLPTYGATLTPEEWCEYHSSEEGSTRFAPPRQPRGAVQWDPMSSWRAADRAYKAVIVKKSPSEYRWVVEYGDVVRCGVNTSLAGAKRDATAGIMEVVR